MQAAGCTGLDALNPVCQIGSLGGSLATSGFESVLNGISQWVASGAEYLLRQIGAVLVSTTTIDVGATWFRTHYGQMTALAGVVILPMLLVSTLQAVLRQNPGQLVRTYLVQLPLALLLAVVAIQVVILSLAATDSMSDAVAGGSGADVASLLTTVTKGLVLASSDPSIASFVLLLIALLIAVAAFVLWMELLIRAAAVYVAVLFLPLALATLVWPAVAHWCRRLVETLAALILSKFVIVATLSLAAGAVASGASGAPGSGGFNAVLAGGALLVLATFVPFAILRLIPAVEAGAVGHLEGLRQRGTAAVSGPLRTAAGFALHGGLQSAGDARLLGMTAGAGAGAGAGAAAAAGALGGGGAGIGGGDGEDGLGSQGVSTDPDDGDVFATPSELYDELMASGGLEARPKGPRPILGWKEPSDDGGGGRGAGAATTAGTLAVAGPGDGGGGDGRGGGDGDGDGSSQVKSADAWKWQGVPPGRHFLYPVRPGQHRFYIDYDDQGPKMVGLPPAWPSDDTGGDA